MAKQKKLCVHCGERVASRPRGLCWRDFYAPGVREQYPPAGKFGRHGTRAWKEDGPATPAREPTEAPPGSPEKLGVLEGRARRQESLWHPADAPADLR